MAEAKFTADTCTSPESPQDPLSRSDSFLHETKYVVLNFMSLLPPDIYSGHVSPSPVSPVSDQSQYGHKPSNHFFKATSKNAIKHAKSLDASPRPARPPKLKYLGKLASTKENYSPASEDNLSYRYEKNCNLEHLQDLACDSPRCISDPNMSVADIHGQAGSTSPRKMQSNLYRMPSDISSSGDFSYNSDADDEYEDFSNASSVFSMNSAHLRGFLDLRALPSNSRLSMVASVPDNETDLDECDGVEPPAQQDYSEDSSEMDSHHHHVISPVGNLPVLSEDVPDFGGEIVGNDEGEDYVEAVERCRSCADRRFADRSKLKLDIPCPVQTVRLDDILVDMQSEINSELSELETEFEDALKSARDNFKMSPRRTPITPQTEAARMLARIGDEVKDQYSSQISQAMKSALIYNNKDITYEQFKEISKCVIDENLPGWRQVALLMVFSQRLVWKLVEAGHKHLNGLLDFSSRLVAEVAADFIIRQGGWNSIMSFDPSQSSDTQSVTSAETSGDVSFFNNHDITQVHSNTACTSNTTLHPCELQSPELSLPNSGRSQKGTSLGFQVNSGCEEDFNESVSDSSQELRDLLSPNDKSEVFLDDTPETLTHSSADNQRYASQNIAANQKTTGNDITSEVVHQQHDSSKSLVEGSDDGKDISPQDCMDGCIPLESPSKGQVSSEGQKFRGHMEPTLPVGDPDIDDHLVDYRADHTQIGVLGPHHGQSDDHWSASIPATIHKSKLSQSDEQQQEHQTCDLESNDSQSGDLVMNEGQSSDLGSSKGQVINPKDKSEGKQLTQLNTVGKTGLKIAILSLAVLAVSLGIRMAVLSR